MGLIVHIRTPPHPPPPSFELISFSLSLLYNSLKEGEADFVKKARLVRQYGAAVVVMAVSIYYRFLPLNIPIHPLA